MSGAGAAGGEACWSVEARDEARMQAIGAALAASAPAGEPRALRLHLQGELGAGKTTLARGLLRALGVTGAVRSPSYALMELYEPAGWRVLHVDLYRLAAPEEVAALGLGDFDLPGSLWLVEWPERAAGALPAPDLMARLAAGEAVHTVSLEACSESGRRWLAKLKSALQGINFA